MTITSVIIINKNVDLPSVNNKKVDFPSVNKYQTFGKKFKNSKIL